MRIAQGVVVLPCDLVHSCSSHVGMPQALVLPRSVCLFFVGEMPGNGVGGGVRCVDAEFLCYIGTCCIR